MLMALLKGKLSREQENMEDILTSNVFGSLKYSPAESALLPFLRLAQTPDGEHPLASLPDGSRATYTFWPSWQEPPASFCEPDVVLTLTCPDGSSHLVLIEAKYQSGKSTEADPGASSPSDQLAKEWDNLSLKARRQKARPALLYITADLSCPRDAINASRGEYRAQRGTDATIGWISWRHLEALLRKATEPMLCDLRESLRRLNLTFFEGIPQIGPIPPIAWSFIGLPARFDWCVSPIPPLSWGFTIRYNWFVNPARPIIWRFT